MHAALLSALLMMDAGSVQAPLVDPNVSSVASGGFWESDGVAGHYRIVVENYGFEVVGSTVHLQWLADATEDTSSRIVFSEQVSGIGPDGPLSIGTPVFELGTETVIVIEATNPYTLASGSYRIIPGAPGEYTIYRAD